MGTYRATILLLTAGMIVLHLLEWLAVPELRQVLHGGTAANLPAPRLRLALRLEGLYYLVVLPAFYGAPNQLMESLMIVLAAYHWAGLALVEFNGFWRKTERRAQRKAFGRSAMWVIGVFDLAEVVVLASLCRTLYAFPWL